MRAQIETSELWRPSLPMPWSAKLAQTPKYSDADPEDKNLVNADPNYALSSNQHALIAQKRALTS
jgi:hypothetical protein